ncbi:MAG: ASCH domain-containing protein [Gammaproteobacteria bacterium]|nr:ASCH domain-containing protein [Gammaproteobacteria bacterium]
MSEDKILHLHLTFRYFDEIRAGTKREEFRLAEKWQESLDKNSYTGIRLYRAFQKVSPSTVIDLPYRGYTLREIVHPHFNNQPALVCAIDVSGAA